jgi:hypothetical protein
MPNQQPYCCGNCPSYYDSGDMRSGQCRRNAPVSGPHKKWPEVYSLDACSEHPSAPMTRQEHLLALIANRLESAGEHQRSMRVS